MYKYNDTMLNLYANYKHDLVFLDDQIELQNQISNVNVLHYITFLSSC